MKKKDSSKCQIKNEFKLIIFIVNINMINLVACVTNYKNKLALGSHGQLLFKLKDDMNFFKNLTINSLSCNSSLDKNIVLMGRKTYFSIPVQHRPLKDRINIVLTKDPELVKLSPVPKNLELVKELYFTDLNTFKRIYHKYNPNVFVIGGSELYNTFLNQADRLYITQVQTADGKDIKFIEGDEPDTFMNHFTSDYQMIGMSEKYVGKYKDTELSYRVLHYRLSNKMSEEYKYLNLMNNILSNGNERSDRTGTGTISLFGSQMRFDISQSIPLLTTKRVPFKTIVEELLWFCRGDTDAKILQKKGIRIWDGNTSRAFLDNQGLFHYPEGVLGAGYGFQWRFQGAKYSHSFADTSQCDTSLIGGFDQLKYVEDLLEKDPFSRRIVISAWNPSDFDKTALVPCHILLQFYVTEENGERYLSCMFTMRSNDFDTANNYNLICYSILTYILAKRHNMKPKEIIYTCGDAHIYSNHIEQVKEQLTRTPRPFPKVVVSDSVKNKDWKDITVDNFDLVGYFPHPTIKIQMAI
jgi:dihydrofolate reductase/thymidylate synthase